MPAVGDHQARAVVTRRAIRVRGAVQGVGFRPTVYRIARDAGLAGFVGNDSEGVFIEIEGARESVASFVERLQREAPPLARIDAVESDALPARGERGFRVVASAERPQTRAIVPPDAGTCEACLRELFDPRDRRYGYPFINCTDCGPRFTIVRDVPYDRAKTTMDAFAMCARCRAEYDDPANRRFHAEPNACPDCGPQVALVERGATAARAHEAIARACALLRAGAVVAVKGLGGYQLAVDARDEEAVARLRERKRRRDKPFALMGRDLATLEGVGRLSAEARRALTSPARPIVLVPRAEGARVAEGVAPRLGELGVMLPAAPIHHLLLASGPALLVMTSGNASDEPIAKDDDDAVTRLGAIADALLVHDRAVHARADDSVVRVVEGAPMLVRRARGYVPDSIPLGFEAPPVLAVGAQQKSTVCLVRGGEAYLSPHIGDLESPEARAFFDETAASLARLLGTEPEAVAHDLHPDYASTRWALARGLPRVPVQHHHAHVAACLVESGHAGPALGVAFDGTGCGPGGELWGGEFLAFDLSRAERLGHLRPIALAGGEAAILEPWRLALAALADADEPAWDLLSRVPAPRRAIVARILERGVASPLATGAGRWFDAIAALVGVRDRVTYDAQAAIELDALASSGDDDSPLPFTLDRDATRARAPFAVDLRPTVRAIAEGVRRGDPPGRLAARFYATMAEVVVAGCREGRAARGLEVVALSGGCFQSARLTSQAASRLRREGFEVLVHRRVPPNDGGVALGQAAVAARRLFDAEPRGG